MRVTAERVTATAAVDMVKAAIALFVCFSVLDACGGERDCVGVGLDCFPAEEKERRRGWDLLEWIKHRAQIEK